MKPLPAERALRNALADAVLAFDKADHTRLPGDWAAWRLALIDVDNAIDATGLPRLLGRREGSDE